MSQLKAEGYAVEIDDDGDVRFGRNGKSFFIPVDETDPLFFRIVYPNFWEIENEEARVKILESANLANGRTKTCKVFVVQNNVWASVDVFLSKTEDFKSVTARCMAALEAGVRSFVDKIAGKTE